MEYPYLLQIETIVACNSQCKMCGMRVMTRPAGKMSWEVFKKVIADCKELPINFICPFINGDPLCDDRMINIIQHIKRELSVTIGWFTNGLNLTRELIVQLADAGITIFNISIHGGNKMAYEQTTGVEWEGMLEKLGLLVEVNKEIGNPFQIRAQMCDWSLTHDSIYDFELLCEKFGVQPCICCFSNFGGMIRDEIGERTFANWNYRLCQRSQHHIYILWNGDAVSCCFDVNGINTFGNVCEQSLKEIWESESYERFRSLHREGRYKELPVCRDCNSNRFNG